MHTEIKKLTRSIYLTISIVGVTLVILFWIVSHSFLSVDLKPSDATFSIDGTFIEASASGTIMRFISPGTHVIEVEADGYLGFSQEINFKRGFPKKISITLKTSPEPLAISEGGEFLTKGNDFNDVFFLEGAVLHRARLKAAAGKVTILENRNITAESIYDASEMIWSPSKEIALLRNSSGIDIFDLKKYDFVNQTEELWGNNIGSIAWSPDNSKVAYYYASGTGEKSLVFANLTNSEMNRVVDFTEYSIDNPLLRWSPDSEWLLIIPRNEDKEQNKIYLYNAYSRTISTIADTGNQLDANFSPDGKKILYSTYSKDPFGSVNSLLSIMDTKAPDMVAEYGVNKKTLGVRAELAKTAWNKDSVNIIVATLDEETGSESIFQFDTAKKEKSGFIARDLGDIYIQKVTSTDDNKVIIYQDEDGIFAINVD